MQAEDAVLAPGNKRAAARDGCNSRHTPTMSLEEVPALAGGHIPYPKHSVRAAGKERTAVGREGQRGIALMGRLAQELLAARNIIQSEVLGAGGHAASVAREGQLT